MIASAPSPARRASESAGIRGAIARVSVLTGTLISLGIVGMSYAIAVHDGGVTHGCLVEGPHHPLAEISEKHGIVTGRFSFLPLGRQCEWERADGSGSIIATTDDWTTTGFVAGGLLLAIAGAGMLGSARKAAEQTIV